MLPIVRQRKMIAYPMRAVNTVNIPSVHPLTPDVQLNEFTSNATNIK
jgi:hypothetical protein